MLAARRAALILPLLLLGLLTGCLDGNEKSVFDQVNAVRAGTGAGALAENHEVSKRADEWAATLAQAGRLWHSDLKRIPVPFTKAAENVAKAGSIEEAQRLLTQSPSHRANMVDPAFTSIGIGTARGGDGAFYVVEMFVRSS